MQTPIVMPGRRNGIRRPGVRATRRCIRVLAQPTSESHMTQEQLFAQCSRKQRGTPLLGRATMPFVGLRRAIGPKQKSIEGLANEPTNSAALRAEFEPPARPDHLGEVVRRENSKTRAMAG